MKRMSKVVIMPVVSLTVMGVAQADSRIFWEFADGFKVYDGGVQF